MIIFVAWVAVWLVLFFVSCVPVHRAGRVVQQSKQVVEQAGAVRKMAEVAGVLGHHNAERVFLEEKERLKDELDDLAAEFESQLAKANQWSKPMWWVFVIGILAVAAYSWIG